MNFQICRKTNVTVFKFLGSLLSNRSRIFSNGDLKKKQTKDDVFKHFVESFGQENLSFRQDLPSHLLYDGVFFAKLWG